ncbi:MAG: hypothetical protein DMG40_12340 [Acidobacteria bacterium]|nr:MAG: hypothetical protein DMG40_12340 [Acidobacteriota bacterium]
MADCLLVSLGAVVAVFAFWHHESSRLMVKGTRQPDKMFPQNRPFLFSFGPGQRSPRHLQRLRAPGIALAGWASVGIALAGSFPFWIPVLHSRAQLCTDKIADSLAKKNLRVYPLRQIEPGSPKNLTAQLKEGAAAARPLRPRFVLPIS